MSENDSLAMRLFGYGLGLFIGSPIIAMLAVMLLVPPFLMLDVEPDLVFAGVLVLGVAGMALGIVFMVASPLTALLRTGSRG